MTGTTCYGTAFRKSTANARTGLAKEEFGAFSYATTVRTADMVSLTGFASYSGGTETVNASDKTYSGTMDLQVRFNANSVSGVVKDLVAANGLRWQHNFADVDRIVLSDTVLRRDARWTNTTVFCISGSGLLRPPSRDPEPTRGSGMSSPWPGLRHAAHVAAVRLDTVTGRSECVAEPPSTVRVGLLVEVAAPCRHAPCVRGRFVAKHEPFRRLLSNCFRVRWLAHTATPDSQAVSLSNPLRLRVSALNSSPTRWTGSPRPRYRSAYPRSFSWRRAAFAPARSRIFNSNT